MRRWLIYVAKGSLVAAPVLIACLAALLVPSTGSCPLPRSAASVGACPYDHHVVLKILIILAGIAVSIAAELATRRDDRSAPNAATLS